MINKNHPSYSCCSEDRTIVRQIFGLCFSPKQPAAPNPAIRSASRCRLLSLRCDTKACKSYHYQFLHCDRSVKNNVHKNFCGKISTHFQKGASREAKGAGSGGEKMRKSERRPQRGKSRKHKTAPNDVRMGKSPSGWMNQGPIRKSHCKWEILISTQTVCHLSQDEDPLRHPDSFRLRFKFFADRLRLEFFADTPLWITIDPRRDKRSG